MCNIEELERQIVDSITQQIKDYVRANAEPVINGAIEDGTIKAESETVKEFQNWLKGHQERIEKEQRDAEELKKFFI